MLQEMQDIIKKNLPAEVGDVLKKRLEECEVNEKLVKDQTLKIKFLEENISEERSKIRKYELFDERNKGLNARELDISNRERELKVTMAELKQSEAEKRASEIFGFVQMVFKSPVYRKINSLSSSYSNGNTTFGPAHSEEFHEE